MSESKTRPRKTGSVFQKVPGGKWHIQYYGPHPVTGEWTCLKEYIGSATKTEAQEALTDRLNRVSKGEVIEIGRSKPTVAKLYDALLAAVELETRTGDAGTRKLEATKWRWEHLRPTFAHKLAAAVSGKDITRYITDRLEADAANATINRELALLRRVYNHAVEQKLFARERVPYIGLLKENNVRQGRVTPETFARMRAECDREGLWLRALSELAWTCGWRRGEMLGLRVNALDLSERSLRLPDSKNGEPRELYLRDNVLPLLAALTEGKQPSDALFTRADGTEVRDFRAAWQNMCIRARVPNPDGTLSRYECGKCGQPMPDGRKFCRVEGCRGERHYIGLLVHDMRRSAARNLLNAGVAQSDVMNTLGHKTASMLKRYAIFDLNASRIAMEKLDAAESAMGNEPSTIPSAVDGLPLMTEVIQ